MRLDRLFKIMVNKKKFIFLLGVFLISAISAQAQKQLPILDMHMHARVADHYGPPPLPICAPVDRMPLWDQSKSFLETLEKFSGCKNPVWSPKTDEEVLRQTRRRDGKIQHRRRARRQARTRRQMDESRAGQIYSRAWISGSTARPERRRRSATAVNLSRCRRTNCARFTGGRRSGVRRSAESIRRHRARRRADGALLGDGGRTWTFPSESTSDRADRARFISATRAIARVCKAL